MDITPEQVILTDANLYNILRKNVTFEDNAVPQLLIRNWPNRAAPGPPSWEQNPILLCHDAARALLQRLPCELPSELLSLKFPYRWKAENGTTKTQVKNEIFYWRYRSLIVEVVALCIISDKWGTQVSYPIFRDRSKFLDHLLFDLTKQIDQSSDQLQQRPTSGCIEEFATPFTWRVWNQASILCSSWYLSNELIFGPRTTLPSLKSHAVPEYAASRTFGYLRSGSQSTYVCDFTFSALCQHPNAFGLDLGTFMSKFDGIFSNLSEVCGPGDSCVGAGCQRLARGSSQTGLEHKWPSCDRSPCRLLRWSKDSLERAESRRAVMVALTPEGLIQATECSRTTMVVSHVFHQDTWAMFSSEGGIMECLHNQLCHIAKAQGCDSYYTGEPFGQITGFSSLILVGPCYVHSWLGSHEQISPRIHEESKFVLIYDKDIALIPLFKAAPHLCFETIIVTLLVSDWANNPLRLIEAAHAGNSLHVLLRDNTVMPLASIFYEFFRRGQLDIVMLIRTKDILAKYLVLHSPVSAGNQSLRYEPPPDSELLLSSLCSSRFPKISEWTAPLWSYLYQSLDYPPGTTVKEIYSETECAEVFWRTYIQKTFDLTDHGPGIQARWLISPTRRLSKLQLSWAPISPLHAPMPKYLTEHGWKVYHSGPNPYGSHVFPQPNGLVGVWRRHLCGTAGQRRTSIFKPDYCLLQMARMWQIKTRWAPTSTSIALLQAATVTGEDEDADVDVWGEGVDGSVPGGYRVKKGRMMVVIAKNSDLDVWIWVAVYVWELDVPLPIFEKAAVTIV